MTRCWPNQSEFNCHRNLTERLVFANGSLKIIDTNSLLTNHNMQKLLSLMCQAIIVVKQYMFMISTIKSGHATYLKIQNLIPLSLVEEFNHQLSNN